MEPIQYVHDPSEWPYPSADPNGQRHIRKKLEAAAGSKRQDPLTYSDLVGDVEFTLPDGRKHSIIVHDWTGFDRMLIGQHLGFLASESFTDHGFMLSAFAVDSSNRRPSNGFFDLGVAFGAFPKDDPKRRDSFWTTQMALAHEFYSTLAEMPSLQEFTDFQRSIFEGAEDKVPATIRKRCSYLLKQA